MKKAKLLKELIDLEKKYYNLVWYSRSDRNSNNPSVQQMQTMLRINFTDETNKLDNPLEGDWAHGFNCGMLAATRHFMEHYEKTDDYSFPDLDS
jgi:hypothetical protein